LPVYADDHPLPGRKGPSEVDDLIAEALELGQKSTSVRWTAAVLAQRAWLRGDSATAIQLSDEGLRYSRTEVKVTPLQGIGDCFVW
jgi:hypothetical protein